MALPRHCLCVYGFDGDMVAGLLRAGLGTAERETMKAGAKPVEVVRLQITAARRKAKSDAQTRARNVFDYLVRVRSSPPQIPSQQPSILMLDGPVSIRFPE